MCYELRPARQAAQLFPTVASRETASREIGVGSQNAENGRCKADLSTFILGPASVNSRLALAPVVSYSETHILPA